MKYLLYLLIFIIITTSVRSEDTTATEKYVSLSINVPYEKETDEEFSVYCYENVPKSVFQFWRSVHLLLTKKPKRYELYCAANKSEVYQSYNSKSMWHPAFLYFSSQSVDFPAFSPYCVGIASTESFTIFLQVRAINYWKVLQTLLGVFIFLTAPTLSRNVFFHYTTGVLFGILSSLLILLYLISRFIPQKSASYAMLLFGYSFFLYALQLFSQHFQEIVTKHMFFVVCYCGISALFSFGVCYRLGPVQDNRTLNLVQWSMQTLALLLIFFSSEYRELSTAVLLLLISVMLIPARWIKWAKNLWYYFSPPKIKLLTEVEYIEQGNVETKMALENLKKFCNSPDCKVWKIVNRLKDPTRFANFIETGNHISDEELLEYNFEEFSDTATETLESQMSNGIH